MKAYLPKPGNEAGHGLVRRVRGTRRSAGGFTLLEMVFSMLVFAVLVGISFTGAQYFWKGDKVESSARKMQSVMMRALRMSVANQEPYAVLVDATQVRLIKASDVLVMQDGDDELISIAQAPIPPGVEIFVRRWEEEDWRPVELETLNFPVSGICEPVGFRLVSGRDILEFALHPLTAYPVDETLLVQ